MFEIIIKEDDNKMSGFKLYEYTQNYEVIADLLEDNPDEDYIAALDAIKESAEEKIINTASFIKKLEGDVNLIKEREAELKAMKTAKQKQIDNIKEYLLEHMLRMDIKKVDTGTRVVRYQNNRPTLNITDTNKVPQEFKTFKATLDIKESEIPELLKDKLVNYEEKVSKTDLMEYLKGLDEKEYQEYAEITQTKSLRIK